MPLGDAVQENSLPSLPLIYNDDKKLSNLQTKPLTEMVVLEKILDDNDNSGGSSISKREVLSQHRYIARPYLIAGHSNFHNAPYK